MAYAIGLRAIRRLCEQQKTIAWYKAKLTKELFKPNEVPVYEWVHAYVRDHHAMPPLETLCGMFPDLTDIPTPDPASYYVDKLERQYFYDQFNFTNIESSKVLKNDPDDWESAYKLYQQLIRNITNQKYRTKIMNFGVEALELLRKEYLEVQITKDNISGFGWPYMDNMGGVLPGDVVSFIGRPQLGKAQPLDSKILTIKGWKRMGDIVVGDELASVDGQDSKVMAIYPQGIRRTFEFTFVDGRTCKASDEHLWEVMHREWDSPRIKTTLELTEMLKRKRYQDRLSVARYEGVHGVPIDCEFSPWFIGVMLGDGCFRGNNLNFSSNDAYIVNRATHELRMIGMDTVFAGKYEYRVIDPRMNGGKINRLKEWAKKNGLMGKKSEHKHIPQQYMNADKNTRIELLKGLMDTDGFANSSGGSEFSSSSLILAKQVQELVRSLGGKANLRLKKTTHLDHYRVTVTLHDRSMGFSLPRKLKRVEGPRIAEKYNRLTITSIEEIEPEECQCIAVNHPRHLYITDNYVVTHNTWLMLYTALHNWRRKKHNVLFVSMEMNYLLIAQRAATMIAGTNLTQLKQGAYSTQTSKKFFDSIKTVREESLIEDAPSLYIVNGNLAADIEEIYILADMLECQDVDIDGAYLCPHKNPKLDRFTRAAENCQAMKKNSEELEKSTFASWQFNREAAKKQQKGKNAELDDIGHSDAIPQISSVVLGLFQEDGIETVIKKNIRVMKGRGGEKGQFDIHWNTNAMNFDQIQDIDQTAEVKPVEEYQMNAI